MSVLDELQKFGTPKEEIALLRMKLECVESKCEKLRDQLRQEREQGAREMVQIVVEFWTKHECDPDAPILSVKQTEEKCMQLWEEWRKGREKRKL